MAHTQPKPCVNRPERFYHATGATLRVGDVVLPGRELRKLTGVGTARGQYVWMSGAPTTTWGVNVYEVEPLGAVEEARGWYRTTRARVVGAGCSECGHPITEHYAVESASPQSASCGKETRCDVCEAGATR
jgi:hypothetical protein